MRLYIILFLSVLLTATACNNNKTVKRADAIAPEKMTAIMTDIHLAEAYSASLRPDSGEFAGKKNMDSLAVFYKEILQHHEVSEEEFNKSLSYYKQNPAELDSVYNKVLPELSKLEGVFQ